MPAAATSVGSQSMVIATCSVVLRGLMCPGQRTSAGMRNPPSRSSVFLPVNGQVSENRSPPLSLVKTTIVLRAAPAESSAFKMRPTCRSISTTMRA